jgi:hypothetical protein
MMVTGPFKIFIMLPILILLLFSLAAGIVLVIKLCSRGRWAALTMAFVLLVMLGAAIVLILGHRTVRHGPEISVNSVPPLSEETTASIWLPGIEDGFEADVYSSRLSAVRSLGLRIAEPIRQVFGQAPPSNIILFQGAHDRELVEEFGRAVGRGFPDTKWKIAPETVGLQNDEVGIRLDLVKIQTHPAPWLNESENEMTSGTIQASVLAAEKQAGIRADFVDKPWVEDFPGFLNTKPKRQLIIAKSTDSCVTEAEANHQAIQDACAQVGKMLGRALPRLSGKPISFVSQVNSDDLLEGGFILDRFVQSFKGTAGRIWRQALLIDASPEKLTQLAQRKEGFARAAKTSWARMFFSILGLLVLITVVYAFLNAATKGYYAWSLRIAGIVLALVVIIFLLV